MPLDDMNIRRAHQPREMAMVSEYLATNNLLSKSATRVRVGNPHPELLNPQISIEDIGILRAYSRWADAIIFEDNKITIIEAKIKPNLGPLEALEVYSRLFLSDPTYKEHHNKPIEKVFLYELEDPVLTQLARQLGIKPVQFEPKFLTAYKKILRGRETRAPLTNIQEVS